MNQQLKESLNTKIQDGEFDVADIPAYLTLFVGFVNIDAFHYVHICLLKF